MHRFSWYEAESIAEAQAQADATVSQILQPGAPESAGVFKAGGIDLLDLMKEGLCRPGRLVGLRKIADLGGIHYDEQRGLRIGAGTTLAQIAANGTIKTHYTALHLSASRAATPHIRNVATLGGNLAQRTRCWYFRSLHHRCLRKGGDHCFARVGENRYHAVIGNGICASVHASSTATALMALGARVEIAKPDGKCEEVPIARFFVPPDTDITRETILEAGELITAVLLLPPSPGMRSHYIGQGVRTSQDWPLAEVAVAMRMEGGRCREAVVALGAAAPVPLISEAAAETLRGAVIDAKRARAAAEAAMEKATPLEKNAYKIPIFKTIIERAVLACTQRNDRKA